MTDGDGSVIDFSEAPRQQEFFENKDGGYLNDPGGNALDAIKGNTPIYAQINNIKDDLVGNSEAINRLFDGEATMSDALALTQMVADIARQCVDAFDAGVSNADGPDLGYWAAAGVKAGLDWLFSSVQPIQDLVGTVMGNPERLKTTAESWTFTSDSLATLAEAYGNEALTNIKPNWEGESCDAAMVRTSEFVDAVGVASVTSSNLSDLVGLFVEFAERVQDRFKQGIADSVALIIGALEDIAKYGYLSIPFIAIDLSVALIRLYLDLVGIALQVAQIYLAGSQLCSQLEQVFSQTMDLLEFLSGVTERVDPPGEIIPIPPAQPPGNGQDQGPIQV
ncbi:hypothetical protein [Salininema proteolyticum]|uniref:Uncharacterized protein n=1 Tax=Salininema proteolyticum TaxID=1607685 RepID=A0ABV8TZS9_9ACTN